MNARRSVILFISIIVLGMYCSSVYGQARDPFRSRLPKQEEPVYMPSTEDTYGDLLTEIHKINLEGIVWSEAFAAAIINGDIYSKGDTIKNINAKIVDIKKGKLIVSYKGKTYTLLKE